MNPAKPLLRLESFRNSAPTQGQRASDRVQAARLYFNWLVRRHLAQGQIANRTEKSDDLKEFGQTSGEHAG